MVEHSNKTHTLALHNGSRAQFNTDTDRGEPENWGGGAVIGMVKPSWAIFLLFFHKLIGNFHAIFFKFNKYSNFSCQYMVNGSFFY